MPKELVAVMSAIGDGQEVDPEDSGRLVYRFRQPVGASPELTEVGVLTAASLRCDL